MNGSNGNYRKLMLALQHKCVSDCKESLAQILQTNMTYIFHASIPQSLKENVKWRHNGQYGIFLFLAQLSLNWVCFFQLIYFHPELFSLPLIAK